ncbi:MAG: oligoendopeptidase F [Acidobacteria bacterium]|jgi:oligoendopeptidase F|nr:oligoendopeptidase F [Acidobacteriota bacterium]
MTTVANASSKRLRNRTETPVEYTWNLDDIYTGWDEWEADRTRLDARITEYAALKGTLSQGPSQLLAAFELSDALGQLAHTVYFFPSLRYDEDQRNNDINAKRQTVEALFARWQQATSWFSPELLAVPLETVRTWIDTNAELGLYRFAIEEVYRQQEHVLDESGEHLLSLAARVTSAASETYSALSIADAKFPEVTLSTGETATMSYGQYRAVLATNRNQQDRRTAFLAHYGTYAANINAYASLYHSVCQRDWFAARARGYSSTLESALHGNAIPVAVVETLISAARAGAAPLQRYHRLRRERLKLDKYYPYDFSIPLDDWDHTYDYSSIVGPIVESVSPLGTDYQARMRRGFGGRWIDVFENEGKRSGAYSAGVYGKHPYMLMNWNDTLDDVFTMAHEMGHSMHTLLSHETQPFVYSDYTIFVAEVASTLNEALLLDHMLEHASGGTERAVLLQHAIDNITSTFYTQVMFADFELQVHRKVERDEPVTADVLNAIYKELCETYYGDAVDLEELTPITWARIPHFFNTPFYVYQYATCFASAAKLSKTLTDGSPDTRETARASYLTLLSSGSNDHPMAQLAKAGVDLSQPETVAAVVTQLDGLVTLLENTKV